MENENKLLDAFGWAVEHSGLKQEAVGKALGMKQPGISLLMGGKRKVRQHHIEKLAKQLNMPAEQVLEKAARWKMLTSGGEPQPNIKQLHPPHMHQIIAALVEIEQLDPAAYGTIADLITLCQQKIKKRPQGTGTA